MSPSLSAVLIEVGSNILLVVHRDISAIYALEAHTPDTIAIPQMTTPRRNRGILGLFGGRQTLNLLPREYPQWSLNLKTRTFNPTSRDLWTEERAQRAELLSARADAYATLMTNIGYARMKFAYDGVLQSFTYSEKEREARECREQKYDELRITEWPYVFQYAKFADISIQAATDEILFKAELRHEALARIETIRLQYMKKIWSLEQIPEIQRIPTDATRELFGNMLS